ncbi:MAG: ParB N-terminal domain-containing protein [Ruminococcus sp.]|nr:ParB N-terminal domain-containing protein [Ruminococcus sp.]
MKPVSNAPKVIDGEVKLIAINMLKPFSKHTFTLYQGERLDDMVESIRKNGVMIPIIARSIDNSDKFEIISGHNRVYASGLAGLEKVPAVIKVGLSDEESLVWAVETNLIQRGFSDLKISDQAFAVAMRYKKLFDAKKLAAIDKELQVLIGKENLVSH